MAARRGQEEAELDEWMKDIAPSNELRNWFNHDTNKWSEFKRRYLVELEDKETLLDEPNEYAEDGTLTLVLAAKDEDHNNAVALKQMLESW